MEGAYKNHVNAEYLDIYEIDAIIDMVEDVSVNYNGCPDDPMDDPADYKFKHIISELRFW